MSPTKNTTAPAQAETKINRRFITAAQGKGGLGKSLLSASLIEYLRYAGVPFKAIDSDALNLSLATRYPGEYVREFDVTKTANDFGVMLATLPDVPVMILDNPSNFTTEFLSYVEHYSMLDVFDRTQTRLTMFVFMSDDPDARNTAAQLVARFGDRIDWIMVNNPKVFKSDEFKRTGAYDRLVQFNAPIITLPEIQEVTKTLWEELEDAKQQSFAMGEASRHPDLNLVGQMELSGFLDRMFVQFENCASLLLPTADLIKNKVVRAKQGSNGTAPARPTRFNNPLLAKR
jgi:hypothetical protein